MKQEDNNNELNSNEREYLKERITSSIFKHQRFRRNIRYGLSISAAAVVISFVFGVYIFNLKHQSIENYVKTSNTVVDANTDKVTLMFEEGKSIDIDEDNSDIQYSSTGEKVKIGKSDEIEQANRKNNKIIYNTLIVPYGKRSRIQLADGSEVWLNSGSKLVYPVTFEGNRREVYLEGEGIFEVAHNAEQPFVVMSKDHEIEVLGTLFNVSNYLDDDSINTTLKNGSVQIRYKTDSFFKGRDVLKISPGTRTTYQRNSNKILAKKVDVKKYFSWRDGIFIFKNDNLKHIMKRLSRYYNVKISVNNKNLENETFSGYLDLKDNVENVIGIIKETSDFEYSVNDNQIVIN